ncbi:MAG: hypothetical protein ABJA02_14340 [Acidobacteriota bacterium]
MKVRKAVLALFIAELFCLFAAQAIFCQTETLDIVSYTPPKGWSKTLKEGAVVYSDVNKATNGFCVLTVYAGTLSSGSPQKDFAKEWNEFVVKPFKAEPGPKTQTQTTVDGWQATAGGSQIELDGGIKAASILTVFTGFGKTASILVISNDEAHLAQASALIDGIKLNKTKVMAKTNLPIQNDPGLTVQKDPFPDKPGYDPQQPLAGTVKESITMADLVGTWDEGGASVTTYVNSSSGNYAGTDTSFYAESYTIKANGTFDSKSAGRSSNSTFHEVTNGIITLSGGYIIVKFTGGARSSTKKYQFISYMTLPNGGAVLSLVEIGENERAYDADRMRILCDHAHGYIQCQGGINWVLRTAKH